MSNTLSRIISVLLIVLLGISAILFVVFLYNTGKIDSDADFPQQMVQLGPILQYTIVWMYILIIIATLSALIFPLARTVTNPKALKNAIIPVIAIVVVGLLSYFLSSDQLVTFPESTAFYLDYFDKATPENVNEFAGVLSKKVGAGINAMYILLLLSILSIIYSEVSKVFK
jgi:tetrahydromethanopterin S-methyltransferase subunit G